MIAEVIAIKPRITAGNQLPDSIIAVAGDKFLGRITGMDTVISQCADSKPPVIADGEGGGVIVCCNSRIVIFHLYFLHVKRYFSHLNEIN
ncbi:Uncharacterised protein [Yersinia enterocolitica]|nr:Uncharacterised protein [Yersinia enterocolitica]CQH47454.1 Uncharacterised protein [Yersinia enterocolitica]CRX55150.1 Uncharacterised protein [Yersinia enterocolitica]